MRIRTSDKEELYRIALNHIVNQYANLPAAAWQAWYLLAKKYN
jgi:hypothetical protein